MNGYLPDAHILIWWFSKSSRLSSAERRVLSDQAAPVFVSIAVAWEMNIKRSLGRLEYPAGLFEDMDRDGFRVLRVDLPHALVVGSLPFHHQDPFDRMLVAQAMVEDLVIVTRDPNIRKYDVAVLGE